MRLIIGVTSSDKPAVQRCQCMYRSDMKVEGPLLIIDVSQGVPACAEPDPCAVYFLPPCSSSPPSPSTRTAALRHHHDALRATAARAIAAVHDLRLHHLPGEAPAHMGVGGGMPAPHDPAAALSEASSGLARLADALDSVARARNWAPPASAAATTAAAAAPGHPEAGAASMSGADAGASRVYTSGALDMAGGGLAPSGAQPSGTGHAARPPWPPAAVEPGGSHHHDLAAAQDHDRRAGIGHVEPQGHGSGVGAKAGGRAMLGPEVDLGLDVERPEDEELFDDSLMELLQEVGGWLRWRWGRSGGDGGGGRGGSWQHQA